MSVGRDSLPSLAGSAFHRLFLDGYALLDLRAPVEFTRGAMPGAWNIPLLNDAERAAVGTAYRRQGPDAALRLGHQLVSGAVRAERLEQWSSFVRGQSRAALYCFRGGLRSQLVQQWLADAGFHIPRVAGGFKALRQYLLEILETRPPQLSWWVLAGRTGSGKTALLQQWSRHIDLEALAGHRGSAFGSLPQPQPSPVDFENALAVAMLRHQAAHAAPILIEDESHLIGRLKVPPILFDCMQHAPLLELNVPLAERVLQICREYVTGLRQAFVAAYGESGVQAHADYLQSALARIRQRLGGLLHGQIERLQRQAFQQVGDEAHCAWITPLVRDYYDPLYDHHRQQRLARRVVQGDAAVLRDWMQDHCGLQL